MTNIIPFPNRSSSATRAPGIRLRDLLVLAGDIEDEPNDAQLWFRYASSDFIMFKAGRLDWERVASRCLVEAPCAADRIRFAKDLARQCRLPLLQTSASDWIARDTNLSEFLAAMVAALSHADTSSPCVVLIDALDLLPDYEMAKAPDLDRIVVQALINELNAPRTTPGRFVIGGCTNSSGVEPAILEHGFNNCVRPLGRFGA